MKFFSTFIIFVLIILLLIIGVNYLVPKHKKAGESLLNDPITTKAEIIKGQRQSNDKYSWQYGYTIQIKNQKMIISAAINLVPALGIKAPCLNQVKKAWEKGIEEIWSHQFAITLPSGQKIPIVVDAIFRGPKYHHDIIVRPGKGRSDQLNWNITDTPVTAAHEFGHILGIYDEYEKGAVKSNSPSIDPTSIMTSNPVTGMVYERHFTDFLEWFKLKTNIQAAFLSSLNTEKTSSVSGKNEDKI
ncbi:MAG: hypothetical protein QNK40_14120 [Desulfobacterales bacterium]|nr:hypothetical protein [Desulfobacterales bacterium]